jgi:hypothetical protein
MTTLHHHPLSTRVRLWKAGIAAATGLAVFAHSGAALAASSWSPTLLVNTESFQTIDDGDGTTDVELRFGGALNERIFWDVETGRFEFTDDVHVQGNLTASGTLTVDGNARTKGDLFLNSDNGATDAVLTFGSDGTAETLTFANGADRFQFSDDVYIQDTLEVDGSAQFDGPSLTIGDAAGDTVTVNSNGWTFANDTNFTLSGGANGLSFDTNTLSIDAAGDRVGVGTTAPDTKLEVIGTVSGTQIHAQNFLTTSGSLQVEGAANIHGTLSGNTIEGFNLTDCDLSTQKLLWDATSKTFVCGTDDSGISQSSADARYVNTSGDTMTGGLTIANGAGLAASGSIRTESDLTINEDNGDVDAILTFGNDGGARTLRFNNTTNNFTFSDDVDVTGGLNTTLDITTDGNLEINEDNGAVNAVLTFGNASGDETITFTNATQEFDISNNTNVAGTFDATGNITTNSDMTINADNGDAAAVLTFGNDASVGSLTYTNDLNPRFSFNDDDRKSLRIHADSGRSADPPGADLQLPDGYAGERRSADHGRGREPHVVLGYCTERQRWHYLHEPRVRRRHILRLGIHVHRSAHRIRRHELRFREYLPVDVFKERHPGLLDLRSGPSPGQLLKLGSGEGSAATVPNEDRNGIAEPHHGQTPGYHRCGGEPHRRRVAHKHVLYHG